MGETRAGTRGAGRIRQRIGKMPPYIQSQSVRRNDADLARFHEGVPKLPL